MDASRVLKERHKLFVALLGVADGMVVAAAAYGAWLLRVHAYGIGYPRSWESFIKEPAVLFVLPPALLAMRAVGLYRPRRDRRIVGEVGQIAKAAFIGVGLLLMLFWAVDHSMLRPSTAVQTRDAIWGVRLPDDDHRFQIAALGVLLVVLLSLERWFFRTLFRMIRRRGWNRRWVAVIGTGRLAQQAARTIFGNSWTGLDVSYFVSHHPVAQRRLLCGRPVRCGLDDLERTLRERPVDTAYIALPSRRTVELHRVLEILGGFSIDVRIVPDVPLRYLPVRMTLAEFDGMPVLNYRESPQHGLGAVQKRLLDVVIGAAALALFSPLMLAIGIAIALTSPGPVIFRQRRVSYGGHEFDILKFRTMAWDGSAEEPDDRPGSGGERHWTGRSDPRITPVGRWLRRLSLDELPQLINVIRGEMSLVGPRPERTELIAHFRRDRRGYMLRHQVKAGMTGWAQVHGLRGRTCLRKRLQYDLFYIRNWSLWLDVRILLMTLWRGFRNPNAY